MRRGKTIAVTRCSNCHSIERLAEAPARPRRPFEAFTSNTRSNCWEYALAEGMSTGHPRMPEFRLEPDQVGDFISFLKSLE